MYSGRPEMEDVITCYVLLKKKHLALHSASQEEKKILSSTAITQSEIGNLRHQMPSMLDAFLQKPGSFRNVTYQL